MTSSVVHRHSIKLEPHRNKKKATHLIDQYKVLESWIWCDCGWDGPEEEFQPHRKAVGALKKQRLAAQRLLLEPDF